MKTEKKGVIGVIKNLSKRYFIDALGAMALGLFSSLIIGLIMGQLARIPFLSFLQPFSDIVGAKSPVVGCCIGVAVAWGLKVKPLAMFSSAVTGALGYNLGGPVGCYVAALIGAEIGNLVAGKTKLDIVLVPMSTIITGGLAAQFVGPGISAIMTGLGSFINATTQLMPIPMGITVSVLMGMALTAPISSAALAIALDLQGLAAGAATVGCCAQMAGFAVASFRENKWGGLIAQGIGTSMLQVPNIVRRPWIWIPPTLASAIIGPFATTVFAMTNIPSGAGMGTSGLVGQFGTWVSMSPATPVATLILYILLLHFIAPAGLTLLFSNFMRKKGWIRDGDMALNL